MAVFFDKQKGIFKLDTQNTTYMLGLTKEGYVGHIYYGPKMKRTGGRQLLRIQEPPFSPLTNMRDKSSFLDTFPMEYSTDGVGDYRESCLALRNEKGQPGVELFYDSYEITDGKPSLEGLPASFPGEHGGTDEDDLHKVQTLTLTLKDPVLEITVFLHYSVFPQEDVITRSVAVRNDSEYERMIDKIYSACLDMDDQSFEMITLTGSWARERHKERAAIRTGKQSVGSTRGESSHQEHPFIALVTPETTQTQGQVYGMNFIYSGNFLAQVEKTQWNSVRMTMGIHPYDFAWRLVPGECFTAPECVLVYSAAGLDGMTHSLHDFYRNHLIRSRYLHEKRPILINNWEATYFDFSTDKLLAIAREAAKDGIEMLVMDDGWFGHRNSDTSSLGDWGVNEKKITGGLKHLAEEVGKIGLKFGIWFEPEMISPDSDLYREHPDWAISVYRREATQSRQQYVLDLTRPEVRDYVYESVASLLRSAPIAYVKWDMNRQLCDLGSSWLGAQSQGELLHRYVLGVYELQERLITEFPDLLLENCSGGGARFDAGMLYYSPQIWCSDDMDPIERLQIQEGTEMIYPLSTMGAHVCCAPNHTTGRTVPIGTRANVALAGTFGYELDITSIPEEDRRQIAGQVELYHRFHMLVAEGDYYRVQSWSDEEPYDCWGVVSKDKSKALFTWVQVLAKANRHSRRLAFKGLDSDRKYKLIATCVAGGKELVPWSSEKKESEMPGEKIVVDPDIKEGDILLGTFYGEELMQCGITVQTEFGDFLSRLYYLKEIGG